METTEVVSSAVSADERIFELSLPKNLEARFATAIFELGLKHSSPKILMVIRFLYQIVLL